MRREPSIRRVLVAAALLVAGCGSATDVSPDAYQVKGTWNYTASQTLPELRMAGVLTITNQTGSEIAGSIEYAETDAQGFVRTRVGRVSGRVRGTNTIDFDAFIDGESRRHVGLAMADSIAGTWIDNASLMQTGSFVARRRP